MLVEDPSPPCATSWTCPGPKATAWPIASCRRHSLRPLGARYCSSRLPSATANDPDDPPWSCQSVSWPHSQASSQTSHVSERCNGRYQRTSGSWTTRSAHSSSRATIVTVTARSWAGDRRPDRGTRSRSVSRIACWRSALTPQPCRRPAPAIPVGSSAPPPLGVMTATDTQPPRIRGKHTPAGPFLAPASPPRWRSPLVPTRPGAARLAGGGWPGARPGDGLPQHQAHRLADHDVARRAALDPGDQRVHRGAAEFGKRHADAGHRDVEEGQALVLVKAHQRHGGRNGDAGITQRAHDPEQLIEAADAARGGDAVVPEHLGGGLPAAFLGGRGVPHRQPDPAGRAHPAGGGHPAVNGVDLGRAVDDRDAAVTERDDMVEEEPDRARLIHHHVVSPVRAPPVDIDVRED